MSLVQTLKQIYTQVYEGYTIFRTNVEKQRAFLDRIPKPKDDLERSYAQYRCQCFLQQWWMPMVLNAAAVVLYPVYQYRLGKVQCEPVPSQRTGTAALMFGGRDTIVPDSLRAEFSITQDKGFQNHMLLTKDDILYLKKLRKRYPFAFYFRFKCMLKVAMYRSVVTRYAPQAVICSEEYSFTSSLLTDYCYQLGVEHINVMHGEKGYYIRDSFFRFDRCYVWDRHYIHLFSDIGAPPEQFVVEVPPCLRLDTEEKPEKTVDYTYYLGNEKEEEVGRIVHILQQLQQQGYVVAIRPHPLYNDHSKFLFQDPNGLLVEDAWELPIEDSLLRTRHAVSLYSTVLLQAYLNGIEVVVDDLTNPEYYGALKGLRFILMSQPHMLLSDVV